LRKLEVELGARVTGEAVHIVIDSSGMKVYGEGRVPPGCAPMTVPACTMPSWCMKPERR
jgi:hypothetical protein